jgi:hypothetical protein
MTTVLRVNGWSESPPTPVLNRCQSNLISFVVADCAIAAAALQRLDQASKKAPRGVPPTGAQRTRVCLSCCLVPVQVRADVCVDSRFVMALGVDQMRRKHGSEALGGNVRLLHQQWIRQQPL